MPDIEIIDKADIPEGRYQWLRLINRLDYNKAIKLICPDKEVAEKQRHNALASQSRNRGDYEICTRITNWGEGLFALFVWKEIK